MEPTFGYTRVQSALRAAVIVFVGVLFGAAPVSAHPRIGSLAPPLRPMSLLQAPPGARADWGSLKGKVVVLEFWATWCSPCVASLPHLNQLVQSLDPTKFQFISIDDEESKAVQTFLTRKKMLGWVGVDTSGKLLAAYGVTSRPTTVIVDGNGKVVAVTEVDSVTAADLKAVAEGKDVVFKPILGVTVVSGASSPSDKGALFSVSITKASADEKQALIKRPPTGWDLLGQDADGLMTDIFSPFEKRYVLKDPLPAGRFDVRVNSEDVPSSVSDSVVQQAVLAALHLQIQPKTITRRAYILRATDASKRLLSPSGSTHAMKRGYWHGIFILMNGSMDDLAYILGTGLEAPVINETGIAGTYDARFSVASQDLNSVNKALRTTLGLELTPADRELPITVFEVSKEEASMPSAMSKTIVR